MSRPRCQAEPSIQAIRIEPYVSGSGHDSQGKGWALRLGLNSELGTQGQSRKPQLGTPGPRTDPPKATPKTLDRTLKLDWGCQDQAPPGCNGARRPRAAGYPACTTSCSCSSLHPGTGEGTGPQGQGVMAEDRVTGGAGAAGVPTGWGVGSKGQAEVQVLRGTVLVSPDGQLR